MKVYFPQTPEQSINGGIKRVLEAQYKYLPEFGIEPTQNLAEAEVTVGHVSEITLKEGKPYINHNHGMMWRDYGFPDWVEKVNREIVEAMRVAYAITSPSNWVTKAINRGTYFPVETIYHGIDSAEWKPADYLVPESGYVLWNKARTDAVSNAEDMQRLAELLPDISFYSTFGRSTENVALIGNVSYDSMKVYVQQAGLYLATARETFGIGTLEALACGVPVVGWDYGGQHEIVIQGETGYLAPFGDYERLADCVRNALRERGRLSVNAVNDVQARWQWRDKVEQYANLYRRAVGWYTAPRPKVSVIVPAHNLAKYLPYTIQSIQLQTMDNFECLIIDDQSTDETPEIARAIVGIDIRFRYLKTFENLKLSKVRNLGAAKALGKYLIYVDADDMLTPNALELLSGALDQDRSLHIAYGALDLINEDGNYTRRNRFPQAFDWYGQMAHQNQIPTAAMMRREVVEQSGGWRSRQWRAEDAEFWSRVTSFGYQARKVTDQTTLQYRVRSDSKGSQEFRTYADRDGNWLANIAWRSANTAQEGINYLQSVSNQVPQRHLVPFGAQGQPQGKFWDVWHHQHPKVTIVVTGNDHLEDTLDSIMGQYNNQWEAIVIGEPIDGFEWAIFCDEESHTKYATAPEALYIHAGEILPSDWLEQKIGKMDAELVSSPLLPNGKILLQYIGKQQGRIPFRSGGRTYYGGEGISEWVEQRDAERLLGTGAWAQVKLSHIPAPALADQRRD